MFLFPVSNSITFEVSDVQLLQSANISSENGVLWEQQKRASNLD